MQDEDLSPTLVIYDTRSAVDLIRRSFFGPNSLYNCRAPSKTEKPLANSTISSGSFPMVNLFPQAENALDRVLAVVGDDKLVAELPQAPPR
jgi:hypothetical protein